MLGVILTALLVALVSALVGVIIGMIHAVAAKEEVYIAYWTASFAIIGLIGGTIGGQFGVVDSANRYIVQYEAAKQTIESSLQNENLSGFERIELVKQATKYNKELSGKQYDATRWYNFQYDDRIFDLEPINLEGGE
jgi:hypothetical protein